ncbi:hypothetical protein BH11ACT5_BH11ACT5_08220 [soil metagenome]
MGSLFYGSPGREIAFDDRALAHLQIVITAKLRRRESFVFSWSNSLREGSGRGAVWLDPGSTLYFHYAGSRQPLINREWLAVLAKSSNSAGGLQFTEEPEARAEAVDVEE